MNVELCKLQGEAQESQSEVITKKNIETRRSTTLKQRVILVQGPC